MEITKEQYTAWAYSVKLRAKKGVVHTAESYEPLFKKWDKLKIQLEYKISEYDSKGQFHYHGIMYIKKGFYRQRLSAKSKDGIAYHLKINELYDRKGWLRYIKKDIPIILLEEQEEPDTEIEIDTDDDFVIPSKSMFKCCTDIQFKNNKLKI